MYKHKRIREISENLALFPHAEQHEKTPWLVRVCQLSLRASGSSSRAYSEHSKEGPALSFFSVPTKAQLL
jgi:hypothetical protein